MPRRKLQRRIGRQREALKWHDLTINKQIAFLGGSGPYSTVSESLEVWEQMREEAIACHPNIEIEIEVLRRAAANGESPEEVSIQRSRDRNEQYMRSLHRSLEKYGRNEEPEDEFVLKHARIEAEAFYKYKYSQTKPPTEDGE